MWSAENVMCLNIGTHKTINFPFGTNGKLMVLGVPILISTLEYMGCSNVYGVLNKLHLKSK